MIRNFLRRSAYLLTGGSAYGNDFELNESLLRFFFYSALHAVPVIVLLAYFNFSMSALITAGVFLAWFAVIYLLTHPKAVGRSTFK